MILLNECPICDKEEWHSLDYLRDKEVWINNDYLYDDPVGFKICKECGFLTYDYQSEAVLHQRYNKSMVANAGNILTQERKKHYHKFFLKDYLKDIQGNVLDYGCSIGSFLKWIKDETSCVWTGAPCDVTGVEIIKPFRSFAKNEYSIDAVSSLDEIKKNVKFDFVSIYKVLEHLQYPYSVLCHLVDDCTTKHALFYISVPTWFDMALDETSGELTDSFEKYYHLNHVNVFTVNSFHNLLRKVGLAIIKSDIKMYGYTVLCEKCEPRSNYNKDDYKLVELALQTQKKAFELFQQKNFEGAYQLCPDYIDAYIMNLFTKVTMKDFDMQIAILEKGLKSNPDSFKLRKQLARTLYQWDENTPDKQFYSLNIRKAEDIFLDLLKEKPGLDEIHHMLGMIEAKYKKNYSEARHYFSKVLEINPGKYNEIMNLVGWLWKEAGE